MDAITEKCLNERQRKQDSSCQMFSIKYETKMKRGRKLRVRITGCPGVGPVKGLICYYYFNKHLYSVYCVPGTVIKLLYQY